jgi:hypothetical protein
LDSVWDRKILKNISTPYSKLDCKNVLRYSRTWTHLLLN